MASESARYPADINAARPRPATSGECGDLGEPLSPCPYVSCKYHLALDIDPNTGSIRHNFGDRELHELDQTCALKVAEHGGVSEAEIGRYLNVVREHVGTIAERARGKVRLRLFREG